MHAVLGRNAAGGSSKPVLMNRHQVEVLVVVRRGEELNLLRLEHAVKPLLVHVA